MSVVMVPDTHVTDQQKEGATLVLKSLEDFQPELFGLPPFQN
jgi:pseudouridine-5'-monophosphatase